MKICSKCNIEKPLESFTITNLKTGKRNIWCKACVKEYDHQRHKNQAPRIRALKKKRRQDIRHFVLDLKSKLKCNRCPENDPACLIFHHINSNEKELEVSNAIQRSWSYTHILNEIAKCEVLCANCHHKHHFYNKSE